MKCPNCGTDFTQNDLPIPPIRRSRIYADEGIIITGMNVGESFTSPEGMKRGTFLAAVQRTKKRMPDRVFECRTLDDGRTRVWRKA